MLIYPQITLVLDFWTGLVLTLLFLIVMLLCVIRGMRMAPYGAYHSQVTDRRENEFITWWLVLALIVLGIIVAVVSRPELDVTPPPQGHVNTKPYKQLTAIKKVERGTLPSDLPKQVVEAIVTVEEAVQVQVAAMSSFVGTQEMKELLSLSLKDNPSIKSEVIFEDGLYKLILKFPNQSAASLYMKENNISGFVRE